MNIVLASNNSGKIREFQHLFREFNFSKPVHIIPQAELGIHEIEETGLSFVENALIKARHASSLSGLPAIADDSGLVVPALHGEPGIYSARYAHDHANAQENIQKLLDKLRNTPPEKRIAAFYCILVFLPYYKDPAPIISEGTWNGTILTHAVGEHGFGYDPIFYVPNKKKSAAELSVTVKNKISHRGLAFNDFKKKLHAWLKLQQEK